MREDSCKTCLIEHDEETHAATERIHEWLRLRLIDHIDQLDAQPLEAA